MRLIIMKEYIKMELSQADFELQSLICTSIGTLTIVNEVDEYENINGDDHQLYFDE